MQLIAFAGARALRLRDEGGFTMFAVMGAMLTVMMISVAAFAAVGGDQEGARRDQDSKRAYSAAEAGVQYYLSRLNQDNSFWAKCDQVPPPAVVNQPWDGTGTDPRKRMDIPGSGGAQFALEVLPSKDTTTGRRQPRCDTGNSGKTMIDPNAGTFQIRSTGFAPEARGDVKRSIIATFRKKGFLDFLYFTDLETANPVTYRVNTRGDPPADPNQEDVQTWASRECSKWYRDGRGSANYSATLDHNGTTRDVSFGCTEINFISGDKINGPLHTNDEMLVCGTPEFGRDQLDMIEASANPGWRGNASSCGADNPVFNGKYMPGSAVLGFPPSNTKLKQLTDPAYIFTGQTDIELAGNNVKVNGNLMPLPPNGLIYVQNGSCGVFYDPIATERSSTPAGCGDAYVQGSYSADLTIAAEKDIIITGSGVRKAADNVLGLIANNFVRVNHPVKRTNPDDPTECTNDGVTPNQIDAAILALNYSFIVDNYYCGNALGTLTVNGAIAQKYRGIVGTFGSNDTGYIKNYNYDNRLRYRTPPSFLDPVQTAWRVMRQVEQTPPR